MLPCYTYRSDITGYDLLHELFNRTNDAFHAHMAGKITFEEYEKISDQYRAACDAFDALVITMVKPKEEVTA